MSLLYIDSCMFAVYHGKSFVSVFFFLEVSINCLFDSLESGKRNSFGKRLEIVLSFASNDCRNPDIKSITFHQI